MYCILNEYVGLRSWWRVPYAYYIKGVREAKKLTKEEFELLSLCDGMTELEESNLLNGLIKRGLVIPCDRGKYTLSPWQKMNCDNRYFPAINWMITGKCNYNCLHCFNASDNAPLVSEFSFQEAEKLLDEAAACGIHAVTLTGGEPMCHKDFIKIVKGIYARGMFLEELNTNGFYINQKTLEKFKEIGTSPLIKISFDGIGHHDWLRNRKGAEENALSAIKLCINNGFRVKVQTNVHRHNISSLLPTAKLLDSMGVSEMRIIRTTEVPRWNENAKGATLALDEYFDRMLDFCREYMTDTHKMDIDIWQLITLFPETKSYSLRPVCYTEGEFKSTRPVCQGNRAMVAVGANGNVYPCMQMSGRYEQSKDFLGNVKTTGLRPLLQMSKYLLEVCATLDDLANANPTCRQCRYFKHCAGGCRAIALTLTDDKMGVDLSKCIFFQNGYYQKTIAIMQDWKNDTPIHVCGNT